MKIAITGGAGFIGSVLAQNLKKSGHDVTIIDLKKSPIYPEYSQIVDICDAKALSKATKRCEAIYHLAAEHRDDVDPIQKYYDVNVEGGKNVIQAAKDNNIKTIIFTSSVAVYGLNAGESKEDFTPAPFNDYGQSKLDSEKTFDSWVEESPENTLTTIRLVATFGPGNRGNIFTLMNQIAHNKFIMVGSGKNHKSIAYVGNVASFLEHCLSLEKGQHHLYNYADKPDMNMKEMVSDIRKSLGRKGTGIQIPYFIGITGGFVFDILAKITGRKFPISTVRVQKFCADTVVNADKLNETGYKRPYSLQDGLREMINAEFLEQKS